MYEEIQYTKNYISEVICRLDFASPIAALRTTMPKAIYDKVKNYYPIAEPQDIIGTEFQLNSMGTPATINRVTTKQWNFLSMDRTNRCTIEAESIVFSSRNYRIFEEFREAIISILTAALEYFPDTQGKRFGLRYINTLPLNGHLSWIETKFSDALAAHKDEKTIRLMTSLEYAVIEEDLRVHLQYGYANPDYPSTIKCEDFVVDIDTYSTGIIYCEDLGDFVDNMHFEDQKCFETMITDALRTEMGKRA